MKKLIATTALVVSMAVTCSACSLFSNDAVVKFGDLYTFNEPKDLKYDERIVLMGEGYESTIEDYLNAAAYPDTMMYDDDGNIVGVYDYDAETGMAYGWNDFSDGSYNAFEEGEEVDLGKPDESLMVDIPGTVTLGFVVYDNQSVANTTYMYAFLSDAEAKSAVKDALEEMSGLTMTEESDKVLYCVQDEAYIKEQFDLEESYGDAIETKDAKAYAEILKLMYGVREYGGENPYKPYGEHEDPADLDFDECIVLTGSGSEVLPEGYDNDVQQITEYIYGKDGKVVADYTYYECASKDIADKLMEEKDQCLPNTTERISDTAFLNVVRDQDMTNLIDTYKGYSVLKNDSLDGYVKMLQETYLTSVYK